MGKLNLQTPAMIHFGEETEDEVFITPRSGHGRRGDRKHRQRAAGRPALLRTRRAREAAEDRRLQASGVNRMIRERIGRPPAAQHALRLTQSRTHHDPPRNNFPETSQRGLAGRGRQRPRLRAADRPGHDARPDGRGRSRRRQVRRRRPVPVRPARRHRLVGRRSEAAGRQGPRSATW